jgi:hypothetical protein
MPKKRRCLLSLDHAQLERRFAELLELDNLASEQEKREALEALMDESANESQKALTTQASGGRWRHLNHLLPGPGIDRNLVFGVFNHMLVFIPRDRAFLLATVHRALYESITWGEFRRSVPKVIFELAVENIETRPSNNDPFSPEQVCGWSDGNFLPWPAQDMLNWVPGDIQEHFGEATASMHNGLFLDFDKERENEIVAALQAHAFNCKRDQLLVSCACGHVPEG